jgi:methionyl-tRNA formyltransferase
MVAAQALRIVFFGTPEFAVPTLDALLHSRHHVVGIVTRPDRPRDRGQRISDTPVKRRAVDAGLPILQPTRLKDSAFVTSLAGLGADLGVVVAYGKILTDEVLRTPRLGLINVHASLLPKYRGAAPVQRAIIDGEQETGVTIMRVVKELDAGPMLASVRRPIGETENSEDVERDLARLGATLLVSTVDALADGATTETLQEDSESTYAHRLTKEDGLIEWAHQAVRIHNLVRALHPWPHAYTRRGTDRLIILRAEPALESEDVPPGTVLRASGDELWVATGEGTLRVIELQAEGKRAMSVREFLAGHHLVLGERFGPFGS